MATNGTGATKDLLTVASGVERLNYFYGQLLTQRDLFTEQRYHLELRRLVQREAFGTGTVAGLRVEDAGATTQGSVFVRAGLAMDPDGRELLLVNDQCVLVADAVATPSTTTYVNAADSQPPSMANDVSAAWKAALDPTDLVSSDDPESLWNHLKDAGLTEIDSDTTAGGYVALMAQLNQITVPASPQLKPGQLLRDVLFDALVGTTYLGLQYAERGTEPSPTVLDASCCGNATCFPSRREEGVVIVAQGRPFHHSKDAYHDALAKLEDALVQAENSGSGGAASAGGAGAPATGGTLDCQKALCETLLDGWRGLPTDDPCNTSHLPVVPIARIYWSRFPRAPLGLSRILSVDNCSRPLAPGVPPVRALLAALTQCTALAPTAPRFDQIAPHDHAAITVDATTNTATVTARATALLVTPIPATSWEIYFYPASPASPPLPPVHWNSVSLPAAPFLFGITPQSSPVPSTNPNVTAVQLVFAPNPPSAIPLALPSGTYRWRLNVDAANRIQALQTHAPIEGILEAVFYVP